MPEPIEEIIDGDGISSKAEERAETDTGSVGDASDGQAAGEKGESADAQKSFPFPEADDGCGAEADVPW